MKNPAIKKFFASIEARKFEERLALLVLLCVIIGYGWFILVAEPFAGERQQMQNRVVGLNAQIVEEANRFASVQQNYNADPNAFARNRRNELQQQIISVDEQLRVLYGQLIQPRRMSEVLTSILQRETTLKLVSLENQPSQVLTTASRGTVVPLVGEASPVGEGLVDPEAGIQVFRHGLQMVFEGDFLETIRYLRSLENLETNFFWQSLDYEMTEWPRARITLNIFTLSTQQEWIGV